MKTFKEEIMLTREYKQAEADREKNNIWKISIMKDKICCIILIYCLEEIKAYCISK